MLVERTSIAGVFVLQPRKHGDARGFFSEVFKASALAAHGIVQDWRQDNHAFSSQCGVVRGLHFQAPPHAQAKLLRVTRGAIFDVVVDIRRGSATYGAHVAVELSAENWRQIYVPEGMAHGYCTLSDMTEVLYKTSAEYAPGSEGGLLWNDPALAIAWPVSLEAAIVVDRDRAWPLLTDLATPFT